MTHFNYLGRIYANELIVSFFQDQIRENTLAHAYIIEGAQGSGKLTLALSVCADMAQDQRQSELIVDLMCTDITIIAPEKDKKSIGINTVRWIKQDAYVIPGELEFKAYIIRESHLMTAQAQNALLKLLEEPPKNVYFFLLCDNSASLLATVRSRAPVVRMSLLSPEQMQYYLLNVSPDRESFKNLDRQSLSRIITMGGGSIGRTKEESSAVSADFEDVSKLLMLLADKKSANIYLHINDLPQKREDLLAFVESFMYALRDIAAMKQSKEESGLFGVPELLRPMAKRFALSVLSSCFDACVEATDSLLSNMNTTNVKIALAASLCRAVKS